jgi:hypothetical protein
MPTTTPASQTSEHSTAADPPVLELRATGDGRTFYRALAKIVVRRELVSAGAIPAPDGCKSLPILDNQVVGCAEGVPHGRSHILPSVEE